MGKPVHLELAPDGFEKLAAEFVLGEFAVHFEDVFHHVFDVRAPLRSGLGRHLCGLLTTTL